MSTVFQIIAEDFSADLDAIADLVNLVENGGGSSRSRLASINSGTLLLAARFEEFVREMCRQYAREIVSSTADASQLPKKLAAVAWKRTLEEIARAKIDTGGTATPLAHIAVESRTKFDALCKFLEGDTSQEIYDHIAHNEKNMRPEQFNSLFKVCGMDNVCSQISKAEDIKNHFDEHDDGKSHGLFIRYLNDFMEKRNNIAHSLNPSSSSGSPQFISDIEFFRAVSTSLATSLTNAVVDTGTNATQAA